MITGQRSHQWSKRELVSLALKKVFSYFSFQLFSQEISFAQKNIEKLKLIAAEKDSRSWAFSFQASIVFGNIDVILRYLADLVQSRAGSWCFCNSPSFVKIFHIFSICTQVQCQMSILLHGVKSSNQILPPRKGWFWRTIVDNYIKFG